MPTIKQLVPLIGRLGGDVDRLLQVIDPTIATLQSNVLRFAEQHDPDRCDVRMLPELLRMLGWTVEIVLPPQQMRGLVKAVTTIYQQKGTAAGLINALRLVLGVEVDVLVAVIDDQWTLGVSELGVSAILGSLPTSGSPELFQVVVPRLLNEDERKAAHQIINLMKPHHTNYTLMEPRFHAADGYTLSETTSLVIT